MYTQLVSSRKISNYSCDSNEMLTVDLIFPLSFWLSGAWFTEKMRQKIISALEDNT